MEIAELSIRVTTDDDFSRGLVDAVEQSSAKVEKRTKSMGGRIEDNLRRAYFASGLFTNIGKLFSKQAQQVEQRAGQMQSRVSSSFAAIGANLIGGFAVERSIAQFRKLETSASEVLTLLESQTDRAFRGLTDDILEFQEELGIASEEAVPALYQAISAGQGDDPFGFLEVAREAAVGGITELKTSVEALSGTVNAYGDEAVTAQRVSDVFFTTVKLGVTTFGELAKAMPNVTATAGALGISIEEASAAIAQLTKNGIDTKRATTFLNQAFVELAKAETQADKTFRTLTDGLSFTQFLEEGNTFVDVIELISEASREADLSVLDMFGSVEAGRAILALTKDEGVGLAETYGAMATSFGATERAAETMGRTAAETSKRISALLQTAQQTFGAQAQPFIAGLLTEVEELLPAIIDLAGTLGGTFALALQAAVPVVAVFTAGLEALAKVLTVVPEGLLGMVATLRLTKNTFSGAAFLGRFVADLKISQVAMAAVTPKIAALSAQFPAMAAAAGKASLALGGVAAALPIIGVAVAGGVALWAQYSKGQQQAADRAEAYGDAVRSLAIPQIDRLGKSVQDLITELDLLDKAVEDALPEQITERAAGFVGVLREVADQKDFDGLELLEELLTSVDADFDKLGQGALENGDKIVTAAATGQTSIQKLDSFIRNAAISQDRYGEATFEAALELQRIRDEAGLSAEQFNILVRAMQKADDAATGYGESLETQALAALNDFKESGNDVVDSIVDQELAMANASTEADRYQSAAARVEDRLVQLAFAQAEAGASLERTVDVQKTSLDLWKEFDPELEDLGDAFSDIIDPLREVENLLDIVNDGLRETFEIGLTARRSVQNLDAAYEDLTESLDEFVESEEDATKLQELELEFQEELKTGYGKNAKAIEGEIKAMKKAQAERRKSLRSLDDTTDSGREAFNVLTDYAETVLDTAEAQLSLGESLGDVEQFLRDQEAILYDQAVAAGVSEQAMNEYVTQLDITPDEISTLIELVGPDVAVQDIAGVLESLNALPQEVVAEIALLGEDATIQEILAVLKELEIFDQFQAEATVSVLGADQANLALAEVTQSVLEINGYPPEIPFEVSLAGADAVLFDLKEITDELLEINGYPPEIPFEISTSTTGDDLADVASAAGDIPQDVEVEVSVTGDDEAILDLTEVELRAADVDALDPEITVEALTDASIADLDEVLDLLNQIDGTTVSATVITNIAGGGGLPGAEAGGVFNVPGSGVPVRIGESGKEYAIPVANRKYRDRAIRLLAGAARDLGVSLAAPAAPASAPAETPAAVSTGSEPVSSAQRVDVRIMDYSEQGPMARAIALDLEELFTL